AGGSWYGPLAFHTSYRFPDGIPRGRFWSFLVRVLYAGGALQFGRTLAVSTINQTDYAVAFHFRYDDLIRAAQQSSLRFGTICMVAVIAVLIRNIRLVKEPDQKRRSRIVLYGTLVGASPLT